MIKPLTISDVGMASKVLGPNGVERIFEYVPKLLVDDPLWSATIIRLVCSAFDEREYGLAKSIGRSSKYQYCVLSDYRDGDVQLFSSAESVLCSVERIRREGEIVSIYDRTEDCFVRCEDSPGLVPSKEVILDGYSFEPLTLAEVNNFYNRHCSRPGWVTPAWIAESAAWSTALVRQNHQQPPTNKPYMALMSNGVFKYYMSADEVLKDKTVYHVSIRDIENNCFVRPSTSPRLVRIDDSE